MSSRWLPTPTRSSTPICPGTLTPSDGSDGVALSPDTGSDLTTSTLLRLQTRASWSPMCRITQSRKWQLMRSPSSLPRFRKVAGADESVRSGTWSIDNFRPIRRLSTMTVGLLGYGRIARRLAAPVEALGARIIAHDPYLEPGPELPPLLGLREVLAEADIVSLHLPLTDETRGLINAETIAGMKPGAILVNTARGPLVDLDSLADALADGRLSGAGLDVFDVEPLDPARIEAIPNLIVTPHMAYYSEEALAESQTKAATQVIKVLTGESPDYQVN